MSPLSPSEQSDFDQNGYFVRKSVFTPNEVSEMSAAFDRLQRIGDSLTQTSELNGSEFVFVSKALARVVWCCAQEHVLEGVATDSRLLEPVSNILASDRFEQLICQAHFKPPGLAGAIDWHQDSQNRRFGTDLWEDVNGDGSYIQTAIAIDQMASDNGPLMFIPGSHRRGPLHLEDSKNLESFDPSGAIEVHLEPGSVAFFGPFLVHGSFENMSQRSRRILINGYCPISALTVGSIWGTLRLEYSDNGDLDPDQLDC